MNVLYVLIVCLLYNIVQYVGGFDFGERGMLLFYYFLYFYFFMFNYIDVINKLKNEKNK